MQRFSIRILSIPGWRESIHFYDLENWLITDDAGTDVHVDVDTRDLVAHFVLDLDGYIKDVFASQG